MISLKIFYKDMVHLWMDFWKARKEKEALFLTKITRIIFSSKYLKTEFVKRTLLFKEQSDARENFGELRSKQILIKKLE